VIGDGEIVSLSLPDATTSVQAEYAILIAALEYAARTFDPSLYHLYVYSDSQTVLYQLSGRHECRSPGLLPYHERAKNALSGWGETTLQWVERSEIYAVFGH
jgi:ribonuclease HI